MKNFVKPGIDAVFIAPKQLKSGEAVVINKVVLIAAVDAEKGDELAGGAEGVYTLPKLAKTDLLFGQEVNIENNCAGLVDKGKDRHGIAWETTKADSVRVRVKINA